MTKIENEHTCWRIGCLEPATHHLRLYVWGRGEPQIPARAIVAQIPMMLCAKHAHEAKLDDVLTIEGWAKINAIAIANDKHPPEPQDMKLVPQLGAPAHIDEEAPHAAH